MDLTALGRRVTVAVDRPMGSERIEGVCPVNLGFAQGREVYVLGVDEPVSSFEGYVIGIIRRPEGGTLSWVAAPEGVRLSPAEIWEKVWFREHALRSEIYSALPRSCGFIPYRISEGKAEFLLLYQLGSGTWSFPKGHMEVFETEEQTARREAREEIGCDVSFASGFRAEAVYSLGERRTKTVVLFLGTVEGDICLREGEIGDCRWLDIDEAAERLSYPCYRDVLLDALNWISRGTR